MPASFTWQPGPTGGTPANATNLNRLAVTADIGTAGTPVGDAVKAAIDAEIIAVGAGGLTVASTVTTAGALVAGKHNPVDATGGAKTMTLPTGTSGKLLSVEKTDASVNAVTVTGNIRGVGSSSISLVWQNEDLLFASDSAGSWWPVSGHKTKVALDTAYAAATQRAGLRLSGGGSSGTQTAFTNIHSRTAFRFPVKPTRMRVHLWNRDLTHNGSAVTGSITITGMYVGLSATDSTGNPTSAFSATPTQVSGSFTTDATGVAESVTAWAAVDVPPGRDLLLSYGMTCTSGQVHNRSVGQMWYSTPGTSLAVTDPPLLAPAGMPAGLTTCWYDMWIEYETADGVPHGLILGDSLTVGTNATFPYRDGYGAQAAVAVGFASTNASWSGTSITADWQSASPKWAAVSAVTRPSWVDIGLGTNDLQTGQTFAQLQVSMGNLIAQVRSIHGPNVPIYVRTIMPRSVFTGQTETDRNSFNAWIRSRPFGITGVFDIAPLVTDPATGNTLLAAYNSGDGTHLTADGYRLIATACRPQWKFVHAADIA